jgi:hypothetical protein
METEQNNKTAKERYNVDDFCFTYTLSRSEFYREVKLKRLHVIKRGRRTYIAKSDAQIWLDKQRDLQAETTGKST